MGEIGEPTICLDVFRDEPDNRILECAVEGTEELIVPGDKTMMAIGEYEGIRLITPAESHTVTFGEPANPIRASLINGVPGFFCPMACEF